MAGLYILSGISEERRVGPRQDKHYPEVLKESELWSILLYMAVICLRYWSVILDSIIRVVLVIVHLQARVRVCLLSWARRIILTPQSTAGNLIRIYCGEENPMLIWAAKSNFYSLSKISPFYTSVLQAWHRLHSTPPNGEQEIRKEIIWNNPRIPTLLGKHHSGSRWSRWVNAGILMVEHLCLPNGDRLRGQEELNEAYAILPTFLEALAIRTGIPITWKMALSKDFEGTNTIFYGMRIDGQEFDLLNTTPKKWYKAIVKANQQESRRKHTWQEELARPNRQTRIDWEAVYTLPYKVSRETKLQAFQYRVINRIITCNKYLRDIRIKQDPACDKCGQEDNITHFLVSCPPIKAFWCKLNHWCDTHLGFKFDHLTEGELILGMINDNGNPKVFRITNWLILITKFYIHRQRLFHNSIVSLIAFLAEVRRKLCVEKMACQREGKPSKFRVWERLFAILSPWKDKETLWHIEAKTSISQSG